MVVSKTPHSVPKMPESRAYTLQSRDKSLTAQKKKNGADDSPPREHFRTMADSKMKHSYSLTSLSSRFLHGASSSGTSGQQTNGHHAHNSLTNGHHGTAGNGNGNSMMLNGKDGGELDGSDDYGFLSYNTARVERDNASKLSSGPTSAKSLTSSLHNNSNFTLGSSNHNGNGGGVGSGSFYSTATYGRLKHSSQQQQQQQQQLHHPQCQHHNNNNGGVASGAAAPSSSSGGGGVNSTSKYEMLRNNFFGSGITRERDPKLNSSCQALNLCANNNGSSNNSNGTSNGNASSIFGASSINSTVSNNTNNNDSLMNGLTGSSASKVGSRTAGTRVRRTISCYAKNPSKLDSLENNLSQQAAGFGISEKDYLGSSMMNMSSTNNSSSHLHHHHHHLSNGNHHHGSINGFIAAPASSGLNGHAGGLGASTASIVHYQPGPAAGTMNGHHHHHHLSSATAPGVAGGPNFPNPICEFSPFSSMSSTDLIGLRMTNGFGAGGLDRRYVGSNGSANFTVYFHDNPIDCGCSTCFQVKLNIFQSKEKKLRLLMPDMT
ncbi:hypothetical protein Ocin01_11837 [Orchesella cincta]|uniref:Uncharacterized protein n=1 Tax=Orchesella cincta TaxID=48709 RepID=A0A1D2MPP3_ORCCI|nr:hypothetical protein Ocin01_11837 [Orchesella cincta]